MRPGTATDSIATILRASKSGERQSRVQSGLGVRVKNVLNQSSKNINDKNRQLTANESATLFSSGNTVMQPRIVSSINMRRPQTSLAYPVQTAISRGH